MLIKYGNISQQNLVLDNEAILQKFANCFDTGRGPELTRTNHKPQHGMLVPKEHALHLQIKIIKHGVVYMSVPRIYSTYLLSRNFSTH